MLVRAYQRIIQALLTFDTPKFLLQITLKINQAQTLVNRNIVDMSFNCVIFQH